MGWYRSSKLAFDYFFNSRDFTCMITPKNNPIQNPIENPQKSFPISSSIPSPVSQSTKKIPLLQFTKEKLSPFLFGARRNYCVDGHQNQMVSHFLPEGNWEWFNNPVTVCKLVLIGAGVVYTACLGKLENVPYTNRTHLVFSSLEKKPGEAEFNRMKESFKGKILPAEHPESVRVSFIAKNILNALQRGLCEENMSNDLVGYALESPNSDNMNGLISLSEEDNIGVEKSRKKTTTEHMEAFNWEILVVKEPKVNAFCAPGGKIVVFTGLLDVFKTDDEIATILGHEIAHALARHALERITHNLWILIVELILSEFIESDLVNHMSKVLLRLPFSREMEIEADYIGLLLMASAGYDPRVAPGMFKKMDEMSGGSSKMDDYLSTHPSWEKRAMLLAQSKVMKEALLLYRERTSGCGIEGFLKADLSLA